MQPPDFPVAGNDFPLNGPTKTFDFEQLSPAAVHFATLSGAVLFLMQILVIAAQLAENAGELSAREAAMGAATIRIAGRNLRWDFIMLPSKFVLGIRARLSAPPDAFNGRGSGGPMRTPFAGNWS